MNYENEIMGVADQAHMHGQEGRPWLKMGDEEIYVLNPLYRLRKTKFHYVRIQGVEGLPPQAVHRATGVVLALCNGKRSVADIARITRPLVKIADDTEATGVAMAKVKLLIYAMCRTQEEREGRPRKRSGFQAPTVLLAKADYDRIFGRTKLKHVEYHARDFLPQNPSEMGRPSGINPREASPAFLIWHFTSECSTDCRYCYLRRRKIKPMPKERVLSLIEEAAAIGVMTLHPAGGDFLLYPHLEDILAALCKREFLPTEIATKSFLSKEKAKLLAENAGFILAVQFSIDSTVTDVADYLVRSNNYCDRIYRSIENALEAGLRVDAKAVITPYNILTIPKLYRDLKKRGVSDIRLAAYRRGFHHADDLFNHPASFQWLEEQIKQLQQEFPDDIITSYNGPPELEPHSLEVRQEAWPERMHCTAGRVWMMICTDGKVIPCEQMPETEEYFCGDVSYQSIQEVWDGDRLRELTYGVPREKFKGQPCYDCKEWDECVNQIGNCIRDLAIHHGSIYLPAPECPKYNRSFIRLF